MKVNDLYSWLDREGAPKMLVEALRHYGLLEVPGPGSNPELLQWSAELGLQKTYTTDSVAWCGLFMAIVATRAGKSLPFTNKEALWARNWVKFGVPTNIAMLGDVLVFARGQLAGHVGMYVGEDSDCYHVLAGNQGDKVSIVRILKNRLLQARRPVYQSGQPANVRRIFLTSKGVVSANES